MKKLLIIYTIFSMFIIVFVSISYAKNYVTAVSSKYENCELGDLVGDDVKRIKVSNFHVDYHSADFSKKQIKNIAKECLTEGVNSQYQMDCCITTKVNNISSF